MVAWGEEWPALAPQLGASVRGCDGSRGMILRPRINLRLSDSFQGGCLSCAQVRGS